MTDLKILELAARRTHEFALTQKELNYAECFKYFAEQILQLKQVHR